MKKLAIAALALVVSTAAHAQFESGKQYIGASMTGLNLSYNGSQDLNLGTDHSARYNNEPGHRQRNNPSRLQDQNDYILPAPTASNRLLRSIQP